MRSGKKRMARRFRVALLIDTRFAVIRDFLAGFYSMIRPEKDWLVMQTGTNSESLDAALKWEPDALIVSAQSEFLSRLDATGKDVLYVMTMVDVGDRPRLGMDEEGVGAMAAEHLHKAGYRHAACVYQPSHAGSTRRMEGYCRVMKAAGLSVTLFEDTPASSPNSDLRVYTAEDPRLGKWLKDLPPSTGIYAWSDPCALWVAETCFREGINIPGKLGLVGTNNQPDICLAAWPNLDSVVLRYREIGSAAATWLAGLEKGERLPLQAPLPPIGVNRRKSTLLQLTDDPELGRFMESLQALPLSSLSVEKLVKQSQSSRRTLERRMRESTGLTLWEVIELRRLEEAEYLLANTERTVADITEACGFATTRSLELLFKKHHGLTPAAYGKGCRASF